MVSLLKTSLDLSGTGGHGELGHIAGAVVGLAGQLGNFGSRTGSNMMVLSSGLSAIPSALGLPNIFRDSGEKNSSPGMNPPARPLASRRPGDGRPSRVGRRRCLARPPQTACACAGGAWGRASSGPGYHASRSSWGLAALCRSGWNWRAELTMLSSSCCSIKGARHAGALLLNTPLGETWAASVSSGNVYMP